MQHHPHSSPFITALQLTSHTRVTMEGSCVVLSLGEPAELHVETEKHSEGDNRSVYPQCVTPWEIEIL